MLEVRENSQSSTLITLRGTVGSLARPLGVHLLACSEGQIIALKVLDDQQDTVGQTTMSATAPAVRLPSLRLMLGKMHWCFNMETVCYIFSQESQVSGRVFKKPQ